MKAFAPAWRPNSTQLAYLTTHGAQNTDLWVAGALWARNVIGRPAWSPDGSAIAFQRDNGIYVASGPGVETQLASIANPGAAVLVGGRQDDRLRRGKGDVHGAGRRLGAADAGRDVVSARSASRAGGSTARGLAAAYLRGVAVVPLAGGQSRRQVRGRLRARMLHTSPARRDPARHAARRRAAAAAPASPS